MNWLDRLGCVFGFHDWSRWFLEYCREDREWFQSRRCYRCDKYQERNHS